MTEAIDNSIAIFTSDDGDIKLEVSLKEDTVWLNQKQMAELFQKAQSTIAEHIRHIFNEGELKENSVHRKFRYTANDGKSYLISHYNLDVVISVGYRVKSQRGTQFRIWATSVLKDYLIRGYATNTKRLIEQKLEIEVRESSKMVEQVLKLKGMDAKSDSQTVIETIATYLGKTLDDEMMILRAQLLTERFLFEFVIQNGRNRKALDQGKFSYRHLLSFAQFFHKKEEKPWLWELLTKLNSIRNHLAHNLNIKDIQEEIADFQRVAVLRLKNEGIAFKKEGGLKTVCIHVCSSVYTALQSPRLL